MAKYFEYFIFYDFIAHLFDSKFDAIIALAGSATSTTNARVPWQGFTKNQQHPHSVTAKVAEKARVTSIFTINEKKHSHQHCSILRTSSVDRLLRCEL
mmetsp:Transcript_17360/g.43328  ORF Transcript_17360/g.43328 Transcript_17360/m.43328 type:complete len:98 (+) Transcript_17360:2183-2476(+)